MKEYKECPICKSSSFTKTLECKDYTVSQKNFSLVSCNSCDFVFTNPIPTEDEIGSYYESEEYISHSNTNKGIVNTLYQKVRNHTLQKKIQLLQSLSKSHKLLDIGCGTGEFLNVCVQNKYIVEGIEPSPTAAKQAKDNYKLSVHNESQLDNFEAEQFDFITMWHVLEHVYHLNDRILQIKRLLSKEGHVIIAVPNRTSYDAAYYKEHWAAYDVPRHLYHFSPKNIEQLFDNHGFLLRKTLPMKFDSYYVSLLSEKYKTSKSNLIRAFIKGLQSNLKAGDNNTFSSQIYVFQKAK